MDTGRSRFGASQFDRFIPNRGAIDYDYAFYALMEGGGKRKKEEVTSPYLEGLAEVMNMNTRRILSFRNKPALKGTPSASSSYDLVHQPRPRVVKPRRYIPLTCERILDTPDIVDDLYLNLLDWSSANVLAVALGDSVHLLNASTGLVSELVSVDEDKGPVTSINWTQDGQSLAVGLHNSEVQLWDASSDRRLVRTFRGGHQSRVGSLAWNDHILTTGGMDGRVINNDVRIRSPIVSTFVGHTREVCGLKWSPSGSQLASGGNDNVVHVWDRSLSSSTSTTRQWLHRFEQHTAAVKALAWCPFQSNLLATGGGGDGDKTIKFWNTLTGACLNSLDTGSQVCSLLWSQNERELLSSNGNQLTLWKYPSLVKMAQLTGHTSRVLYTAQSPDGCTVASAAAGDDETLRFWNVFGVPGTVKKPVPKVAPEPFSHVIRIR